MPKKNKKINKIAKRAAKAAVKANNKRRRPKSNRRRKGSNGLGAYIKTDFLTGGFSWNGPPVARPTRMRPSKMKFSNNGSGSIGTLTISGRDLIDSVVIKTTSAVGDKLMDIWCNPWKIPAQRLSTIATMYERYEIEVLGFIFEGSVPTTQNGTLMGYYEYDIQESVPASGGIQSIQRASAHTGAHPVKVWESSMWNYVNDKMMADLYVDTQSYEPRLTTPAHFILLVNDLPTVTTDTTMGKLYVNYVIHFHYPKVHADLPAGTYCAAFDSKQDASMTQYAPFGNVATSPIWSTMSPTDIHDNIDPYGAKTQSFNLPRGSYMIVVRTYSTDGGVTGGDIGGYSYIPLATGMSGVTASFVTTYGPTHPVSPAYFVAPSWGNPIPLALYLKETSEPGQGSPKYGQIIFLHVTGPVAPIFVKLSANWSATANAYFSLMAIRLPNIAAERNDDMIVQYARMVGQMRSFQSTFARELASSGAPLFKLDEADYVEVSNNTGAAASAVSSTKASNDYRRR